MEYAIQIVFVGVFATAVIDVWALFLKVGLRQQTTDIALIGRWLVYVSRGVFFHHSIAETDAVENERVIGLIFHYVIGIIYAVIYIVIVMNTSLEKPAFLSALLFGLITVLAPWLIMQPGFGLGVLAHKSPNPVNKCIVSLSIHGMFGMGLFAAWWLFNRIVS